MIILVIVYLLSQIALAATVITVALRWHKGNVKISGTAELPRPFWEKQHTAQFIDPITKKERFENAKNVSDMLDAQ